MLLLYHCLLLLLHTSSGAQIDDWLVTQITTQTTVNDNVCWDEYGASLLCGVEISNEIITRRFALTPEGTFGTIDFLLNATGSRGGLQSMFRAIEPEARLVINGKPFVVGGLNDTGGDGFRAYRNKTGFAERLGSSTGTNVFRYSKHRVSNPVAPFPWTPGHRHGMKNVQWPPKGRTLAVDFVCLRLPHIVVTMWYEMYDGVPLLSKWITVTSSEDTGNDIVLNGVTVDLFAAQARFGSYASHGSRSPGFDGEGTTLAGTTAPRPLLHVKTDQAHGAACQWTDDYPNSASGLVPGCPQCKDEGAVEPLLNCSYTIGPGAHVSSKESFVSFRALLLATDSTNLDRHTLSKHRLTQLLAPHVTENPIFFHAQNASAAGFKNAIDQMAEVGFEMLIFSFGSGFVLETNNETYLAQIKQLVDYARSKDIEVGGYDLICLDRGHGGYGGNVGDQWVAIDQKTGALKLDACFASGWYDKLHGLVRHFINATGLSMLETDGPYGGGECASTNHSHHHGHEDSVYRQTQMQNAFYRQMRSLNVYVNQPDSYFYQGGSRSGMGYSEQQYSLPAWRDISISRSGMYDDFYSYLPTQGWMFVPLDPYHAGGDAASFQNHPEEYEWALAQYLGGGTAACYRGTQLWDPKTPEGAVIKQSLIRWVSFYKSHRQTMIAPVVGLRRPDMQSWDGWLHVRPFAEGSEEVGVAMLFNPTDDIIDVTVNINLYFTGLVGQALVEVDGGKATIVTLARDYGIDVPMVMVPRSIHTVVVRRPK